MHAKRILIIGPAWVGDMVMVQSLFMALKDQNQDNIIDVIAPHWSAPVLARMPEVRRIIEVDLPHGALVLSRRIQVGKRLRGQYDQAIVCPRTFKSALIPYFAKIPQRTAYRGEMRYGIVNDMRPLDTDITYKSVEKYVNLGSEDSTTINVPNINFPRLHVDINKRHITAQKLGVNESKPFVALMPGAEYGPSKRWPAEHFGELALKFKDDGLDVYAFGSPKDKNIGEEIAAFSNHAAKNLCGQTSLEEVIDLLSLAKVAITNDSGLMHIAAAVNRPLVAIYGAITPEYTPPLSNKAEIQYLNLDCSPCWKKECPFGHYNCLRNMEVSSVYESASRLLNSAIN